MRTPGWAARPITQAQTRHPLAPSRFSALVGLEPLISWPYLYLALHFRAIEIRNPEQIIQALGDFQAKRTRLIVAFRHAYGDEPHALPRVQ